MEPTVVEEVVVTAMAQEAGITSTIWLRMLPKGELANLPTCTKVSCTVLLSYMCTMPALGSLGQARVEILLSFTNGPRYCIRH